ncbi:MAG: DUF2490 domain-containing protein [Rikenellaceae bacterium]
MKLITKIGALLALIITLSAATLSATEIEKVNQVRLGFDMSWKLAKGLKLNIAPEMRRGEDFVLDQFQMEAGLRYKTFGFLYWRASYRFIIVPDHESSATYYTPTDKNHRYGFSLTAKQKFGRFTPSLRALYSNYSDEDIDDKAYMRYRAKVEYNIRKSPFTPYIAIEAYHGLDKGMISKMRYNTGFDLKVKKGQHLNVDYKFDLYTLKYKNRNVYSIGYKFDF